MCAKYGASFHPGAENLEKTPRYLKTVDPCLQSAVIVLSNV